MVTQVFLNGKIGDGGWCREYDREWKNNGRDRWMLRRIQRRGIEAMRMMKAKKHREEEGERIEKLGTDKETDKENVRSMKVHVVPTLLSQD